MSSRRRRHCCCRALAAMRAGSPMGGHGQRVANERGHQASLDAIWEGGRIGDTIMKVRILAKKQARWRRAVDLGQPAATDRLTAQHCGVDGWGSRFHAKHGRNSGCECEKQHKRGTENLEEKSVAAENACESKCQP